MIPKIIHQMWVGKPMSPKMTQWTKRIPITNPSFEHMFWNEHNLAELVPPEVSRNLVPSCLSDLVRVLAVQKYGGIYLDTDVEVLKSLDQLLEYQAFIASCPQPSGEPIWCNAVFGAEPEHPWVQELIPQMWELTKVPYTAESQHRLAKTPITGKTVTLIPTEWVFPWLWYTPQEQRIAKKESLCLHHWLKGW